MATATEKKAWVMPEWMERYRDLFENTGGNSIEELMNLPRGTAKANFVLSTLACCAESQVTLLLRMHRDGLLK